jgi:hypothetical protein
VRVFISYRRSDSRHVAGRLRDALAAAFGDDDVFLDVDSVGFGDDFREVVRGTLAQVDAVLVVIGPSWDPERLQAPNDFVRMELIEALDLGKRVVPVLLDDTLMPSTAALPHELEALSYRNAAPLRADPDFKHDVERLIDQLRRACQPQTPLPGASAAAGAAGRPESGLAGAATGGGQGEDVVAVWRFKDGSGDPGDLVLTSTTLRIEASTTGLMGFVHRFISQNPEEFSLSDLQAVTTKRSLLGLEFRDGRHYDLRIMGPTGFTGSPETAEEAKTQIRKAAERGPS